MSELETLIPQAVEIQAGGETVVIRPAKMRNIEPAIQAALPILQALKSDRLDIETLARIDLANLKTADILDLLEVYAEYGGAVSEMVAHLAGVSVETVRDWSLDEYVIALATVVRVNLVFFASWVRPTRAAPEVAQPMEPGHGPSSD